MSSNPRHSKRDAALNAARYQMQRSTEEQLPADEYAEKTGRRGAPAKRRTPLQIHAEDEVWEVANSALDEAIARGDFDNLALAGQRIDHVTGNTDPDWWLKGLMRREQITGLGPEALTLRVEDREMDQILDRLAVESQVREYLADFNRRIINARRQLQGGPPVVTPLRDVEDEVGTWRLRRARRAEPAQPEEPRAARRRPWWRRPDK